MLTLKFKDVSAAESYGVTVSDILSGFTKAVGKSGSINYNASKDTIYLQLGTACPNSKDNICLPVELTDEDGKNIVKLAKNNKKEFI